MKEPETYIEQAVAFMRDRAGMIPKAALVLGSGMTAFADGEFSAVAEVPYAEVPGMVPATAPAHNGGFLFGIWNGVPVAVMRGRLHFYEGYTPQEVVYPIRVLRRMGAEILLSTNAVGGINPDFAPGDIMVVDDHIASFMPSPLRGGNDDAVGVRYPDMTDAYDPELRRIIFETAESLGIPLKRGVFIQLPGPQFETPAEIRMCRTLGADAVGMSTAIEVIAARHCGLRTAVISYISNLAAGISGEPITVEEVMEISRQIAPVFRCLLGGVIANFGKM